MKKLLSEELKDMVNLNDQEVSEVLNHDEPKDFLQELIEAKGIQLSDIEFLYLLSLTHNYRYFRDFVVLGKYLGFRKKTV